MATIITVHGTNSTGPEEGSQWWQKGSEFEKDVHEFVEAEDGKPVEFKPFIWDGKNSETSRRDAGRALADQFLKIGSERKRGVAIGHSHGGSIIENACAKLSRGRPPSALYLITVGSPFPQGKSYSVLSGLDPIARTLALTITILSFILAALALVITYLIPKFNGVPMFLISIATLLFAWLYLLRRMRKKQLFRIKMPNGSEMFNCLVLRHRYDEAINGLSELSKAKFSIFSADSVISFFISIALAGLIPLWLLASFVIQEWLSAGLFFHVWQYGASLDLLIWILLGPTAIVLAVWLLTSLVSTILAGRLNILAGRAIVQKAMGGDTSGEFITGVSPQVFWVRVPAPFLPDEIGGELASAANEAAAMSIPKLREAIGQLAFALSNEGDPKAMAQYLTWDELIHTTYFKVPRFRKLVCYAIAHSPGFRPSNRLKADPDYEKLGQWLAEIKGEAASAPTPQ